MDSQLTGGPWGCCCTRCWPVGHLLTSWGPQTTLTRTRRTISSRSSWKKTTRIPRSLSVKAASILKGFLNKNPADRLGCHRDSGFAEIMTHAFFKTIEWELLEQKQIPPPYRPRLESERDLANFPPEFTDEPVQLTPDDQTI